MTRLYKVAVLECDTPLLVIVEKSGTYGQIFKEVLRHSLEDYSKKTGAEVELQITWTNVVNMGALPAMGEVDCILLSGSSTSRLIP